MNKKTIIFAGGGTGGHVYPAISIAKELLALSPEITVHFVGTADGFEAKLVPAAGFSLSLIPVGKLNMKGNFLGKIKTLLNLPRGFWKSYQILKKHQPAAVIGVGGYASGPFVLTAALCGYKTAIWEPNAHPGLTNRWLSSFVQSSYVVFEDAKKLLKSKHTATVGLPVRREIEELGESIDERSTESPIQKTKFHLLVFGGSQGARAINDVVSDYILQFANDDIEVVHQSGKMDFQKLQGKYATAKNVKLHEFLNPMKDFYEWADLVVCRSGASTVAEVMAARKPAVFIPLPWAADDHQKKNAESLLVHKACWMIEQKNLTPESLRDQIELIRKNHELQSRVRGELKRLYSPRAAVTTAKLIVEMATQQG